MKCIPNRELDELGEGLVRTYLSKTKMIGTARCVDIEGLANSLGLTVTYEQFAETDYDKIGFLADGKTPLLIWRNRKIVPFTFPYGMIVLDRSLCKETESGKRRFTIAHEVAHFILDRHNPAPQFHRNFDVQREYSEQELRAQFNMTESQADKLAASLLMPFFLVERALKDINNGNKVRIFGDNVISPDERIILNKMAAQIGVSFTALLIRLRQFGMLDYHPLGEYIETTLGMEVRC